jgi:propanol-preferring alcohol dehydrogenase
MVLDRPGMSLVMHERPVPAPGPGEILIEIEAYGVCRTDLHVVDGELPADVSEMLSHRGSGG